jgi:hypothetical protein
MGMYDNLLLSIIDDVQGSFELRTDSELIFDSTELSASTLVLSISTGKLVPNRLPARDNCSNERVASKSIMLKTNAIRSISVLMIMQTGLNQTRNERGRGKQVARNVLVCVLEVKDSPLLMDFFGLHRVKLVFKKRS